MGEWERNSFHQLAFTNIQLSYLCNLFQTAEIQTPKSISYLKSNEKNESFQAEQEIFFGFKKKNTKTQSRWHTIDTKKAFKFHLNRSWTVIWVNHRSKSPDICSFCTKKFQNWAKAEP